MRKKKKTRWLPLLLIALLLPALVYTSRTAWRIIRQSDAEQGAFEALAARVAQNSETPGAQTEPGFGAAGESDGAVTPESEAAPREILAQYRPLHEQNPDFFGWLKIEDTVIDYPVMFTPKDPEYYLHRSFDGAYSYSGTPFVEGHCSADGIYYIIYAHHMKNGTMFGTLPKYAEQAYWEAHPVIRFDTLYEQRAYRVVAAFKSRVYGEREVGAFRYYEYTDLSDPRVFDEYVSQARAAALYDTGVEIGYGDELLALSTCNYHTKNGRFVVVARRMKSDEETLATAE